VVSGAKDHKAGGVVMSDMVDDFQAMRQHSQEKRERNRHASAEILDGYGVGYSSNNDGAHLIVRHADKVVDFWPGTGKYCFRGTSKYKRGVYNLLSDLGVKR